MLPEIVNTNAEGYKSVDYTKITPVPVEAIKELQLINEKQDKAIDELKFQVSLMKAEYIQMKTDIKQTKSLLEISASIEWSLK